MSEDSLTLAEGRARYFAENGFAPDGGYGDAWVHFKLGPLPLAFPNTKGRVEAVRFHDLNHVVTGYATDLRGEAEIGAWELASGCTRFPAAVLLNLLVIWPVLFLSPGRVWRAFLRGRHSRNLYSEPFDEALLARPVGPTRTALGLDAPPHAGVDDALAFAGTLLAVVGIQVFVVALLAAPLWLWLR